MESDLREDWDAATERVRQVISTQHPVAGPSSQALQTMTTGFLAVITAVTAGAALIDHDGADLSIPIASFKLALAVAGIVLAVTGWQRARRRNELVPLGMYQPARTLTSSQRRAVHRQIGGRERLTAAAAPVVAMLLRTSLATERSAWMVMAGFWAAVLGSGIPTVWVSVLEIVALVFFSTAGVVSWRRTSRRLAEVEREFPGI